MKGAGRRGHLAGLPSAPVMGICVAASRPAARPAPTGRGVAHSCARRAPRCNPPPPRAPDACSRPVGMLEAFSYVVRMFSGVLSDRMTSRKAAIAAGFAMGATAKFGLSSAGTLGQLFVGKALDRLGNGVQVRGRAAAAAARPCGLQHAPSSRLMPPWRRASRRLLLPPPADRARPPQQPSSPPTPARPRPATRSSATSPPSPAAPPASASRRPCASGAASWGRASCLR